MTKDSFKLISILIVSVLIITLFSTSLLAIKTFNIQETDKISLTPESIDLDGDKIVYYYSTPLNDGGEWETNYDDAGEYLVDITASDGINKTIETIKIVVENKNQAPIFSKKEFTFQEKDLINIKNFRICS